MEDELGYMNVELDGRFSAVRTQETNLGKMRQFTNDWIDPEVIKIYLQTWKSILSI